MLGTLDYTLFELRASRTESFRWKWSRPMAMITLRQSIASTAGDDSSERVVFLDLVGVFDVDESFIESKLHAGIECLPVHASRKFLACHTIRKSRHVHDAFIRVQELRLSPALALTSVTSVVSPRWAVVRPAASPAGPAPMMTTSQYRSWSNRVSELSSLTVKSATASLLKTERFAGCPDRHHTRRRRSQPNSATRPSA